MKNIAFIKSRCPVDTLTLHGVAKTQHVGKLSLLLIKDNI